MILIWMTQIWLRYELHDSDTIWRELQYMIWHDMSSMILLICVNQYTFCDSGEYIYMNSFEREMCYMIWYICWIDTMNDHDMLYMIEELIEHDMIWYTYKMNDWEW